MGDDKLKFVPLSAIVMALDEATEGWKQYLDLEDMKVAAIPDVPEEIPEYIEEPELLEEIEKGLGTRFLLLPSEEEMSGYDLTDLEESRKVALQWCQAHGLSTLDDLDLIGKRF